MKVLFVSRLVAITAALLLFAAGCQKESMPLNKDAGVSALITSNVVNANKQQERPLKGAFVTSTTLIPDWAGGYNPYVDPGAPAWYPGSGAGNLTHLGLSVIFLNQHIVPTGINEAGMLTGVGTTPPVNDFYQTQLASYDLTVPNEVGWIFLDKKGNSIWSKGSINYWSTQDNMWRIYIDGTMEIIGGTGKFADAKGQYTLSGVSVINLETIKTLDSISVDGTIVY